MRKGFNRYSSVEHAFHAIIFLVYYQSFFCPSNETSLILQELIATLYLEAVFIRSRISPKEG